MKIKYIASILLLSPCFAERDVEWYEEALYLGGALRFPLSSNGDYCYTNSFFPESGVIITNEFKFVERGREHYPGEFRIFSNEQEIAYGRLYEATSYLEARRSLLFRWTACNAGIEYVANNFIKNEGIGDFCFGDKAWEQEGFEKHAENRGIYFIRGYKAVEIRMFGNENNGLEIARMMDNLIKIRQPTFEINGDTSQDMIQTIKKVEIMRDAIENPTPPQE